MSEHAKPKIPSITARVSLILDSRFSGHNSRPQHSHQRQRSEEALITLTLSIQRLGLRRLTRSRLPRQRRIFPSINTRSTSVLLYFRAAAGRLSLGISYVERRVSLPKPMMLHSWCITFVYPEGTQTACRRCYVRFAERNRFAFALVYLLKVALERREVLRCKCMVTNS